MFNIVKQNGHISYGIKKFVADTVKDIDDISLDCKMGSEVKVIATGDIYILNSKYEWVKQKSSSAGGGSQDTSTLEEENAKLSAQITELQKQIETLKQEIENLKNPTKVEEKKLVIPTEKATVQKAKIIIPKENATVENGILKIGG